MTRGSAIACAFAAAALFGASTPLAKLLLGDISPLLLAAILYLGSGLALSMWLGVRALRHGHSAPLERGDWPWLAGAIAAGGIAGPVLLMLGLAQTTGSTASLLLNLEGVFTAAIAWSLFRENVDRRVFAGMVAIVAGGVLLSWEELPRAGSLAAPLLIAAACLAWAIDNNFTRRVSAGDAVKIACLKGVVAGSVNLAIAVGVGASLPGLDALAGGVAVGAFGYGLSLVLFIVALRHLGTARTAAYFSVAPFFGAALALAVLGEQATIVFYIAGALMAFGVWLHVRERHVHEHLHQPMTHTHSHLHDEHHRHEHDFPWDGREPHAHPHRHAPLVHAHPHYPDLHHRHEH
jgi:drug/metabolite transporter (DMT)-like permease